MDDRKKMSYTNFPIFLKICLAAMVEIVVTLGPRFFCNLHHKFFNEKKIETNSIISRAYFG